MSQLSESCCTVKETVQEKYDAIARGRRDSCYCLVEPGDYQDKTGYQADADLGLGCGTPVDHADLQPGEIVLDLGSGAGLDAMIAAPLVGSRGKIVGVDLTPSM
ncbi:MAG: arsenite S-adenosylmethyltransferase, partial [Rhodothermaceae bacterium]|nr:arsenite S-adenosylmethyltransferase [Rhodothermaceae bacterium]